MIKSSNDMHHRLACRAPWRGLGLVSETMAQWHASRNGHTPMTPFIASEQPAAVPGTSWALAGRANKQTSDFDFANADD